MPADNNFEAKLGKGALGLGATAVLLEVAGLPFSSLALLTSGLFATGWVGMRFFNRSRSPKTA